MLEKVIKKHKVVIQKIFESTSSLKKMFGFVSDDVKAIEALQKELNSFEISSCIYECRNKNYNFILEKPLVYNSYEIDNVVNVTSEELNFSYSNNIFALVIEDVKYQSLIENIFLEKEMFNQKVKDNLNILLKKKDKEITPRPSVIIN